MDSLWDTSDSSTIVEQSGVEVIGLFLGSSLSVDQYEVDLSESIRQQFL